MATWLPIMPVTPNQLNSFKLSAMDPDGDPVTFRAATPLESGLNKPIPTGMTVSADGSVSWTPLCCRDRDLRDAGDRLDGRGANVPLELMLESVPPGPRPTLTINGSSSPPAIVAPAGLAITIPIVATDSAGVELDSGLLPQAAVVTPSLPAVGASTVNAVFTWTPGIADAGRHVVWFGAPAAGSEQSAAVPLIIDVVAPAAAMSGTLRLFGGLADFGRPDGDNAIRLVGTTLEPTVRPCLPRRARRRRWRTQRRSRTGSTPPR